MPFSVWVEFKSIRVGEKKKKKKQPSSQSFLGQVLISQEAEENI